MQILSNLKNVSGKCYAREILHRFFVSNDSDSCNEENLYHMYLCGKTVYSLLVVSNDSDSFNEENLYKTLLSVSCSTAGCDENMLVFHVMRRQS